MTSKEALEELVGYLPALDNFKEKFKCVRTLETTIERKAKLEKVWGIIKRYIDTLEKYGEEYCICFGGFEGENGDLTKEEFNLLKEIMKDEN